MLSNNNNDNEQTTAPLEAIPTTPPTTREFLITRLQTIASQITKEKKFPTFLVQLFNNTLNQLDDRDAVLIARHVIDFANELDDVCGKEIYGE